MKKCHKT